MSATRHKQPAARRLPLIALTAIALTILLWPGRTLTGAAAAGQTPKATPSPTPAPGATDPMGSQSNYTLLRNDGFFLAGSAANGQDPSGFSTPGYFNEIYTANQAGTTLTNFTATSNTPGPGDGQYANLRIAAGAGRIMRPDREQGVIFKLLDWQDDSSTATYYVEVFEAAGVLYQHTFPAVTATLVSHLDVAVADLDGLRGSHSEYQDEVVLVSESGHATTQLTVISFLDTVEGPQITSIDTGVTVGYYMDFGSTTYDKGGQISAAVGDFDGDGLSEIAVTTISTAGAVNLSIYRYTNDGRGNAALALQDSQMIIFGGYQYADVAAGDFNGDGHDEVMIAWVGGDKSVTVSGFDVTDALKIGTALGSLTLGQADNGCREGNANIYQGTCQLAGWVQIKAGLFKWDPNNGYSTRRRQLGVIFGNAYPVMGILEIPPATAADPNPRMRWLDNPGGQKNQAGGGGPFELGYLMNDHRWILADQDACTSDLREGYTLTAGKFGGYDDQDPQWHLAAVAPYYQGVSSVPGYACSPTGDLTYNLSVTRYDTSAATPVLTPTRAFGLTSHNWTVDTAEGLNLALVAADFDGKSLRLGAPVHITVPQTVKTDFVLQEPPKHAFYDNRPQICDAAGMNCTPNPTYGWVVTVSRQDTTNVALVNKQGTAFTSEDTSTTDWSIGASAAGSAKETVAEGDPDIEGVQASFELKAQVGYDYDSNSANYNSNYSSQSLTLAGSADHDDLISGQHQDIDIWRYPIFGATVTDAAGNQANAFHDLVLPGQPVSFPPSGGLNWDWYQPLHENGNILSYPPPGNDTFTPSDLGSYEIPCTTPDAACTPCAMSAANPDPACGVYGKKMIAAPLVPASQQFYSGTQSLIQLNTSSETGAGGSISYRHKLAESVDVSFGYKATATLPEGTSGGTQYSLDVNLHNSNSWGDTRTHKSTTTSSTGITINTSSGDPSQAYAFYPVFYTTQDGTVKVAHAVANPADPVGNRAGFDFWAGIYGRKPDPALNLPQRFKPTYSSFSNQLNGWEPNTLISRKLMRGFFLRKASQSIEPGENDYLADAAVAGDQVKVEARVYNYSTAQPVSNLLVRFQAVAYDAATDTETGPRTTIGEQQISLDALGVTVASVVWDTSSFGPAAGATAQYRIYVVLDPDNKIDEIYETENPNQVYPCADSQGNPCQIPPGLDPGQNNEGFGYASVKHKSAGAEPLAQHEADVSLRADSLAARNHLYSLRTGSVPAQIFRPLSLRAKVYSDRSHTGIGHLLVYDGDPARGGRLIAGKLVDTGDAVNGGMVWFEWTPRTLGEHKLYARLLERPGDSHPGNNVATLLVNVVPFDSTPPSLAVRLTPNVLHPADGRMVAVTAAVTARDDQDAQPEVKLESITSSEARDAAPDVSGAELWTDDRSFSLRAKQSARGGPGRVYTVVYSATDWAGNKTKATAYVRVTR